ncbi:MAG: hypothetical protein F6K55_39540 [Moorea sp. SIO4A3]|nr:hypothetical protein [Moorena sp. SIO4A3]
MRLTLAKRPRTLRSGSVPVAWPLASASALMRSHRAATGLTLAKRPRYGNGRGCDAGAVTRSHRVAMQCSFGAATRSHFPILHSSFFILHSSFSIPIFYIIKVLSE